MLPAGKFPVQRVAVAAIAFLITGGMLFGGYALVRRVQNGPLDREHWKARGILDFQTREQGDGLVLEVEAGRIRNLRPAMEDLINQLEKVKGKKVEAIRFTAPRASGLENVYDSLSFALAEALTTGRYTLLPGTEAELGRSTGVETRIEIGEKFVFVSLEKGRQRLYRAVRRPSASTVTYGTGGGG